jgi:hypothetical protein
MAWLFYRSVFKAAEIDEVVGDMMAKDGSQSPSGSTGSSEILSKVTVPNNQVVSSLYLTHLHIE